MRLLNDNRNRFASISRRGTHQKTPGRHIKLPHLVAGIMLLSMLGSIAGCHSSQPAADKKEAEGGAKLITAGNSKGIELDDEGAKLAEVTTETAAISDLLNSVHPTGEVAATDTGSVLVTSRLPGRIADTRVAVGAHVHKNDVIATIDSVDLNQAEAAYRTAVAHATLTHNQLLQQRKLAGFGTISEQPIEDARKALAAAEATVSSDEAQIKLDRLTLTNTQHLVEMGEITRKPVEDAQNAYAQSLSAQRQAKVTLQSTKANLNRANILFQGAIYSKQQLEDAETAYNSAVAAAEQADVAEKLAAEELKRQQNIFSKDLNGASALQTAQSKLQQDEHSYTSDLTAQELARKQYARAQVVYKSGIPVSQALQQAQDTYDEAVVAVQGAVNTLKLYGVTPDASAVQLANGRVVIPVLSPIDGIVTQRTMIVGQMTDTATPLVKIVNLDQVYVDSQVYEKDIAGVHIGDPISLKVSALPASTFHGVVTMVGREVSPDTRTLTVRTMVQNPGWLLRPGMFATVIIGSLHGVKNISVPSDAILQEGAEQILYVETAPRKFVQHSVKTGTTASGRVGIRSGISPGDKVVITGGVLLQQEQDKLESEQRGKK